jgi:hypothetical protein
VGFLRRRDMNFYHGWTRVNTDSEEPHAKAAEGAKGRETPKTNEF